MDFHSIQFYLRHFSLKHLFSWYSLHRLLLIVEQINKHTEFHWIKVYPMGLYAAIFSISLSLSYFSIIIIIIDAQRTFIEYMMILFDYSALFMIILSFIELWKMLSILCHPENGWCKWMYVVCVFLHWPWSEHDFLSDSIWCFKSADVKQLPFNRLYFQVNNLRLYVTCIWLTWFMIMIAFCTFVVDNRK